MSSVPVWAAVLLALMPSVVAAIALVEAGRRDRGRIDFERGQALREERIGAYCHLLAEATGELYNWDASERELDALNHAFAEVQPLSGSPDLIEHAGTMMAAIHNLRVARLEWTGDGPNRPRPQFDEARWAVHTVRIGARQDLRLDEPPPVPTRWERWRRRWSRGAWDLADRATGRR